MLTKTKAKGTKSPRRNVLRILSFKQFANQKERNAMQKKRMQNKRMKIKSTLNVKITLNVK